MDPRNISPRSDSFISILGPVIATLEHDLANAINIDDNFLVKGCSIQQRKDRMKKFLNYPYIVETDYSRMDMSISAEYQHDVELTLLNELTPYKSDEVLDALLVTMHTRGTSDFGVKYDILGTRCSGDVHTSISNGLINDFNIWLTCCHLDENKWCRIVEGDDGCIGLSADVVDEFKANINIYPCLGFQLKAEIFPDINLSSFCGRFLFVSENNEVESYADIYRTLAKFHTSVSSGKAKALLCAKAMSYYMTDRNTPLIGQLCYRIIQLLRPELTASQLKRAWTNLTAKEMRWRHTVLGLDKLKIKSQSWYEKPPEVSSFIRASVALRTGLSPRTQVEYEKYYSSWQFIPESVERIPQEWMTRNNVAIYGSLGDYVL